MNYKKIISFILVATLFITSAQAVDSLYLDVSIEDPYYKEILFCTKEEITNGTGKEQFSPDSKITLDQYLAMFFRVFEKERILEETNKSKQEKIHEIALNEKVVSQYDLNYKQNQCNWIMMLEILFKATDYRAYSSRVWHTEDIELQLPVPTQNKIVSAREYGFLNGLEIKDFTAIPTRAETIKFIYNIITAKDIQPKIVREFKAIFFDQPINNSSYSDIYQALDMIPKKLLDEF